MADEGPLGPDARREPRGGPVRLGVTKWTAWPLAHQPELGSPWLLVPAVDVIGEGELDACRYVVVDPARGAQELLRLELPGGARGGRPQSAISLDVLAQDPRQLQE